MSLPLAVCNVGKEVRKRSEVVGGMWNKDVRLLGWFKLNLDVFSDILESFKWPVAVFEHIS